MTSTLNELEAPRPHYRMRQSTATLAAEPAPEIGNDTVRMSAQDVQRMMRDEKDKQVLQEATQGMTEQTPEQKTENNKIAEQLRQQEEEVIATLKAAVQPGQPGADQRDAAVAEIRQLGAQFQETAQRMTPEPQSVATPEPAPVAVPERSPEPAVQIETDKVQMFSPEQARKIWDQVEAMKKQIANLEAQVAPSREKPAA